MAPVASAQVQHSPVYREEKTKMALLPTHSKDVVDRAKDRPKGLTSAASFFVLCLWYTFSGCTLFLNKYLLSNHNLDPHVLGVCQLLMTTVLGFIQMKVFSNQPIRSIRSHGFLLNMLLVGVLRFGTVVLSLVSLKYVAVSFTETVKSSAPLFTVLMARCMLGEKTRFLVNCALIPVMLGLALCSSNEISFNIIGFAAALSTNMVECCQNVYSKLLISAEKYSFTPTELQFYASLFSLVVQLPVAYFLLSPEQLQTLKPEMIWPLLLNCIAFHLQSYTAYILMDYISPVTYSVANTVKRALLIWFSVVIFGNPVTVLSGVGTAIVLLGVLCYNWAQQAEHARAAPPPVEEPPEAVTVDG